MNYASPGIINITSAQVNKNMNQEADRDFNITANQRQESDNQYKLNQPCTGAEKVYFMSIICSPKLLQDPTDKSYSFSNLLWSDKQIKSIRQLTHNVEISINNKNERLLRPKNDKNEKNIKKELTEGHHLNNENFQKQLQQIKRMWTEDYPHFKRIIQLKRIDQQKTCDEFVKSMKGKNFLVWHMPLRDQGPKLRKLVISKLTLKMLGYEPQEFNFQFEKYTDVAVELLGGWAYKECFTHYLNCFSSFMSTQLRQDISLQQCTKKSILDVTNQMKGKNNLSIKVQMRFMMPNAFTICHEMLRVVQQNEQKDKKMSVYKDKLSSIAQKTAYNSLCRITRLPRQMNPDNTSKICSYEIIREPEIQQLQQKCGEGSQSEYIIEQEY